MRTILSAAAQHRGRVPALFIQLFETTSRLHLLLAGGDCGVARLRYYDGRGTQRIMIELTFDATRLRH